MICIFDPFVIFLSLETHSNFGIGGGREATSEFRQVGNVFEFQNKQKIGILHTKTSLGILCLAPMSAC